MTMEPLLRLLRSSEANGSPIGTYNSRTCYSTIYFPLMGLARQATGAQRLSKLKVKGSI